MKMENGDTWLSSKEEELLSLGSLGNKLKNSDVYSLGKTECCYHK